VLEATDAADPLVVLLPPRWRSALRSRHWACLNGRRAA